jgi:hypothetical protein
MQSANLGGAKIAPALASPASYFEMTFQADEGRPYHLWIRARAESNSWANDSVHVQFDRAVTAAGAAAYRIGTSSSVEVNLEDCSGCGLSGWGWQDNDMRHPPAESERGRREDRDAAGESGELLRADVPRRRRQAVPPVAARQGQRQQLGERFGSRAVQRCRQRHRRSRLSHRIDVCARGQPGRLFRMRSLGMGLADHGYGASVRGIDIRFAVTGMHTMRVQVREDGFGVDHIVLSAAKYLTVPPGALTNDATILAPDSDVYRAACRVRSMFGRRVHLPASFFQNCFNGPMIAACCRSRRAAPSNRL